jgi:hypothetical protein
MLKIMRYRRTERNKDGMICEKERKNKGKKIKKGKR